MILKYTGGENMKLRKRPIIIDGEPYKPGMEDGFDVRYIDMDDPNSTWGIRASDDEISVNIPYINTLEGKHYITKGDWILTGVKGERYPCKPDIVELTYEKVDE